MVHPWNQEGLVQVRLLWHDVELCLSSTMDASLEQHARAQAAKFLREEAHRLIGMAQELEKTNNQQVRKDNK
jgi:DICT domain-containing protein